MGFFSKVWKKVKKGFKSVFKKIGKGISKIFKGIGKFMGKIGIVGQLAMSFILPGIGQALSKTAGGLFTKITGALAKGGKIAKAAGKMLEAGVSFAKMGHSAFKTVTDGVSSFVTEMGQAALSKIPGIKKIFPNITDKKFKTAWNNVQDEFQKNTETVMENFDNLIGRTAKPADAVTSSLLDKGSAVTGKGGVSGTAEIKGFDEFKPVETPSTIDTSSIQQVDIPDNFGMDAPDISADFGTKTETLGGGYRGQPVQSSTTGGILDKADIKIDMPKVENKSLLEKASDFVGDAISNTAKEIKTAITEAPSKLPEYLGDRVESGIEAKAVEKIDEALGITPEQEEQVSYGYAAAYEPVTVGEYQSQAINDRAYQMALDPVGYGMQNPFGYPAQDFYKQQMLQFSRPQ